MSTVEWPPVVVGKRQCSRHPGMGVDHDIRPRIEGIVRSRSNERVAFTGIVGTATTKKCPGTLDEDDIDRRGLVACVSLEELSVRLDRGFDSAQHRDLSADAIRLDGQRNVGSHDRNRWVLDAIGGCAKRCTRQNDRVGLLRQGQKTVTRFLFYVCRHRACALHRLAQVRPKFMMKIFL
ncbi:hypothetical protein [Pandoraea capi]|uniref:hypothetical protein n=1 Tax=Pandoraea capi TaxID=2508286 RepID=UPI0015821D49|nr:hypothetical protein [Pandoraea capi]